MVGGQGAETEGTEGDVRAQRPYIPDSNLTRSYCVAKWRSGKRRRRRKRRSEKVEWLWCGRGRDKRGGRRARGRHTCPLPASRRLNLTCAPFTSLLQPRDCGFPVVWQSPAIIPSQTKIRMLRAVSQLPNVEKTRRVVVVAQTMSLTMRFFPPHVLSSNFGCLPKQVSPISVSPAL